MLHYSSTGKKNKNNDDKGEYEEEGIYYKIKLETRSS